MPKRDQPYNGHKNWTHWNVALWISNDEGMYHEAVRIVRKVAHRKYGTYNCAARCFKAQLPERTPDGARYSLTAVKAALIGLEIE